MKRHPALVPLSRDHHHALVIGRRLREASAADAADSIRAFLAHWEKEEQAHFRIEELFPLVERSLSERDLVELGERLRRVGSSRG